MVRQTLQRGAADDIIFGVGKGTLLLTLALSAPEERGLRYNPFKGLINMARSDDPAFKFPV
jgi:hypothetical protein